MERFGITISPELRRQIEAAAQARGCSTNALIREVLERAFAESPRAKIDRIRAEARAAAEEAVRDELQAARASFEVFKGRAEDLRAHHADLAEEVRRLRAGLLDTGSGWERLAAAEAESTVLTAMIEEADKAVADAREYILTLMHRMQNMYLDRFEKPAWDCLRELLEDTADHVGDALQLVLDVISETRAVRTPAEARRLLGWVAGAVDARLAERGGAFALFGQRGAWLDAPDWDRISELIRSDFRPRPPAPPPEDFTSG